MNISKKTQKMILTAIFAAIIIVMTVVPFLGYINVGVTRATLIQVPVIIGAILLGPKIGAFLGFVFGLTSLWMNTFSPTITSFCFSPFYSVGSTSGNFLSLIICFVPRILIGVCAYYVFVGLKKAFHVSTTEKGKKTKETAALAVAGLTGALVNTVLVMGMIYLFFAEPYAVAKNVGVEAVFGLIMGVVSVNGVMEAIVSAVLTALICRVMLHVKIYRD